MNFDEQAYLDDPYRTEFTGRVLVSEPAGDGLSAVYLDRTWFYPDSGGQPADRGTLGGLEVAGVNEDERGVRHLVRGVLPAGAEVEGRIDRARRLDHMQQHSGQHLLSRVFLESFRLPTVSFHLGERACTIDLEGPAPSPVALDEAENAANGIVFANAAIRCSVVDAAELSRIGGGDAAAAGGAILRSRLPGDVDRARVVEIEGCDRSTCCGTHVRSTGEIGIVKILGMERSKGNARIEFVCGARAARDYAEKHRLLAEMAAGFSTDWREVPRVVEKIAEAERALRKRCDELGKELAGYRAAELAAPTGSAGGFDVVKRVFAEGDAASLRETATRIRELGGKIVLFGLSGPAPALVFGRSPEVPLDMGQLMKACAPLVGARGGGGKDFAQGGGGDGSRVAEALDEAERRIKESLGS